MGGSSSKVQNMKSVISEAGPPSKASRSKKASYTRSCVQAYHENKDVELQRAIEHYMPPRFPLIQTITEEDVARFSDLWLQIYHDKQLGSGGQTLLASLFDVFYYKLFERSEKFREFFGDNFKERCRILTRQMIFFTTLRLDENLDKTFEDLGKLHRRLGISNWQFSMFVEVLLEALSSVLGDRAEMIKMQSATRVISFCLFRLLQSTLRHEIIRPTEMNVNFKDNVVERIIEEMEEEHTLAQSEKMRLASEKMSDLASLQE